MYLAKLSICKRFFIHVASTTIDTNRNHGSFWRLSPWHWISWRPYHELCTERFYSRKYHGLECRKIKWKPLQIDSLYHFSQDINHFFNSGTKKKNILQMYERASRRNERANPLTKPPEAGALRTKRGDDSPSWAYEEVVGRTVSSEICKAANQD